MSDARTPVPGTTRFNLRIDTPKHGWADTTVTLGDTTVVINASDVGPDCFRELASVGLFAIQAHEGSQSAEFFEEPCGRIIRVTHGDSGDVTVTIHDTSDLTNATARHDLVASVVMPRAEFAAAVWRGLRAHERLLKEAHAGEHWLAFPDREVELLGRLLRVKDVVR